jgi:AraC-like DNA-binding protein
MLLFLSLIGVFLSVLLLFFNTKNNRSTIYLGIFFFLISLYALTEYILIYSKSVFFISIFYIHLAFLSYLIGPVLFWYVRSVLTDKSRLKKIDIWHLLPMLIFFLAALPYFFTSSAGKLEIAARISENPNFIGTYHATPLYDVLNPSIIILSRPLLIFLYAIYSTILILTYIRKKSAFRVLSGQKFMTTWLSVLMGFMLILTFCHLLFLIETITIQDTKLFFTLNLLQVLSGVGMTGLLVSPFFFPNILYGLPKLPKPFYTPERTGTEKQAGPPNLENEKYTQKFEYDYINTIRQLIDTCMQEKEPYLDPDCNLAFFSGILQIPVHHLAYYFREIKQQPFNEYRNEWRVKHAKNLINDGKAHQLTFEAIGRLSGFSSRSAFFAAFKKVDGIPPGIYAERLSS